MGTFPGPVSTRIITELLIRLTCDCAMTRLREAARQTSLIAVCGGKQSQAFLEALRHIDTILLEATGSGKSSLINAVLDSENS